MKVQVKQLSLERKTDKFSIFKRESLLSQMLAPVNIAYSASSTDLQHSLL